MDPRMKVVLILLVGATIGAVVAAGTLSLMNGPGAARSPQTVTSSYSSEAPSSSMPSGGVAPAEEPQSDPSRAPLPNITRRDGEVRMYGSEGPAASVSTDPTNAPPPSPKQRRPEPKSSPVVEEEAEPKVSDGGSVREKDGDEGGSLR